MTGSFDLYGLAGGLGDEHRERSDEGGEGREGASEGLGDDS